MALFFIWMIWPLWLLIFQDTAECKKKLLLVFNIDQFYQMCVLDESFADEASTERKGKKRKKRDNEEKKKKKKSKKTKKYEEDEVCW